MHDALIIGGGVIGLSLAWELARHGRSVRVIDQGEPGREASWAGAGIIPAATRHSWQHPYEQLRGLACELQPRWAEDLKLITGIDNGYRRCGGLHLARTPGEAAALAGWAGLVAEEGIECERLSAADLNEIEPGIDTQNSVRSFAERLTAFLVPGEAQLRNPWHLQALIAACQQCGVSITPHVSTYRVEISDDQLTTLETSLGPLKATQFCFTAGAWTGPLLQKLDVQTGIFPVRGQMALFHCERPPIARIINEGSRYLVPRDDGRVLAGSTEEEVGFDKTTTEEAISDLVSFARELLPALRDATIERTWAGLRPGSFDGLPYLGRLPGISNAYVSAGHFRSGLYLSAATAVVMSQLMRCEEPEIDLAPFRIGR